MATGAVAVNFDANLFFDQTYVRQPSRFTSVCVNLFHESDGTVSQIRLNGLKSIEFSTNYLFSLIDPRLDDPDLSYQIAEATANQAIQDCDGFLKPNVLSVNFLLPLKDVIDTKETQKNEEEEEEEEESTCAICFGDFREDKTMSFSLNCSHRFHVGCIGEWLVWRKSCPLCRGTVVYKEL